LEETTRPFLAFYAFLGIDANSPSANMLERRYKKTLPPDERR